MHANRIFLLLIVLGLVALPVAADCGGEHASKTADKACCSGAEGATCASDATEAVKLAEAAGKGCQASMGKLIAMAKESDHEEAAALAVKAEGGCKASEAALIAMAASLEGQEAPAAQPASMEQLAKWAGGGCSKSAASLIAMAKDSGNEEASALAARAEGGCEHSKAALIAMYEKTEASEKDDSK